MYIFCWALAIIGILAMFVFDTYAPAMWAAGIISIITLIRIIIKK